MSLPGRQTAANRMTDSEPTAKTTPRRRYHRVVFVGLVLAVIAWFVIPDIWLSWQLSAARRELSKGKTEAAVERLQRAITVSPRSAEVNYRLAVAQRRAGHLDSVEVPLAAAKKLGWSPDDIERQVLLATAQSGDVDAVDARLKSIMARGASDEAAEEIYEALAIGFLKTYRLKEAWDCLNYWGEWQPKAIFPKFWRADICRRIMNPTAEEQEYREILAIDPDNVSSRYRLAEVLKDSNRIEEAAREYQSSLKRDSRLPEAMIGLAECQRRLGQITLAIPLLSQALELKLTPAQRSAVLTQLGQIKADAGEWPRAIEHLEQAVELAPSEATTLFALSQAYSSSGQEQKGLEALERSRKVRAQRDRIEEIARILVDQPGSAELRYEAGKILMDLGMKDDGAAWLQTALKMQPNHEAARSAIDDYEREKSVQSK